MILHFFEKDIHTTLTLKVNESFNINNYQHPSVGWDTNFEIEDETVLALEEEIETFFNDDENKPRGGDQGEISFLFKAKKLGQTLLSFHKVYRFKNVETVKIRVKVVAE